MGLAQRGWRGKGREGGMRKTGMTRPRASHPHSPACSVLYPTGTLAPRPGNPRYPSCPLGGPGSGASPSLSDKSLLGLQSWALADGELFNHKNIPARQPAPGSGPRLALQPLASPSPPCSRPRVPGGPRTCDRWRPTSVSSQGPHKLMPNPGWAQDPERGLGSPCPDLATKTISDNVTLHHEVFAKSGYLFKE